jgi:hypothetical protein
MLYNIVNEAGNMMLACNTTRTVADKWLEHYRRRYGPGVPYPNGKGYYDMLFAVVPIPIVR